MMGEASVFEELANGIAQQLRRSTPMPLRPQDAALLATFSRLDFGDGRAAWEVGEGPLVLFTHGWGGRGSQLAGLASYVAENGYRCGIFDAGGHGDSKPEGVGFDTFINDTSALARHFGEPVHAWVGHSAGALGMMAARQLRGLAADRYVCIAAPRFPYVPIETLRRNTGAPEEVLELVKEIVADQFSCTWRDLENGQAFDAEPTPLLLAYDRSDERVRHLDADAIAQGWPSARVLKTDGYGHNKVLQSPEVWTAVLDFLNARS